MGAETSRMLGNFTVEQELGSGVMGEILLGTQPSLDRWVVLKKLRRELASNGEFVERFHREACVAATLHHSNVVTVYDYFSYRGSHYIALEYVDGLDLQSALERTGGLPHRLASLILLELARGIEAIHGHGMVHRDIKPGNVLISRGGEVKITDFGIALDPMASPLTQPGFTVGSPAYMSPEQLRGERVDTRSDVFALGVVLYEMLTGHPPYPVASDEDSASLLERMKNESYPPLSRAAPKTPSALRRLVTDCLRPKPKKRLASVQDLRRRLEQRLGRPTHRDARAQIGPWLWELGLFQVREGETVVNAIRRADPTWRAKVRWITGGFASAAVVAALAFAVVQQQVIIRELTAALPRDWSVPARLLAAVANEQANVTFALQPGVKVWIDDKFVPPARLAGEMKLSPGSHKVTLEHPECGRIDQEIALDAGERGVIWSDLGMARSQPEILVESR